MRRRFWRTCTRLAGSLVRPTTSGPLACSSSSGIGQPGTTGTLAHLMPRLARYMHVGVFEVRETPTRMMSALSMRSEEHTSELQSLMRISYAVFCLKKKITKHNLIPIDYVTIAHT